MVMNMTEIIRVDAIQILRETPEVCNSVYILAVLCPTTTTTTLTTNTSHHTLIQFLFQNYHSYILQHIMDIFYLSGG